MLAYAHTCKNTCRRTHMHTYTQTHTSVSAHEYLCVHWVLEELSTQFKIKDKVMVRMLHSLNSILWFRKANSSPRLCAPDSSKNWVPDSRSRMKRWWRCWTKRWTGWTPLLQHHRDRYSINASFCRCGGLKWLALSLAFSLCLLLSFSLFPSLSSQRDLQKKTHTDFRLKLNLYFA